MKNRDMQIAEAVRDAQFNTDLPLFDSDLSAIIASMPNETYPETDRNTKTLVATKPFCYHDGRNIVDGEFKDDVDVFPLYREPFLDHADLRCGIELQKKEIYRLREQIAEQEKAIASATKLLDDAAKHNTELDAQLVQAAKAEREACAKVCDTAHREDRRSNEMLGWSASITSPCELADLIRARKD